MSVNELFCLFLTQFCRVFYINGYTLWSVVSVLCLIAEFMSPSVPGLCSSPPSFHDLLFLLARYKRGSFVSSFNLSTGSTDGLLIFFVSWPPHTRRPNRWLLQKNGKPRGRNPLFLQMKINRRKKRSQKVLACLYICIFISSEQKNKWTYTNTPYNTHSLSTTHLLSMDYLHQVAVLLTIAQCLCGHQWKKTRLMSRL